MGETFWKPSRGKQFHVAIDAGTRAIGGLPWRTMKVAQRLQWFCHPRQMPLKVINMMKLSDKIHDASVPNMARERERDNDSEKETKREREREIHR